MPSQTSTPQSSLGGVRRGGKNELMRQWRKRSVVTRLLPGLFWLLWGLVVVVDGTALVGCLALGGVLDSILPASFRASIHAPVKALAWPVLGQGLSWLQRAPAFLLGTAHCWFAMAWAGGLLFLVSALGKPGRAEPGRTLAVAVIRFLVAGTVNLAAGLVLSRCLDGQAAVRGMLALGPGALALALLLARRYNCLGDFGLVFWTVVGLALLTFGWLSLHPLPGVTGWALLLCLACISLALHAAQHRLFGPVSTWKRPAGKSVRKPYRKPAVASH